MNRRLFRAILGVMLLVSVTAISCDRGPTVVRLNYEPVNDGLSLDLEVTGLKKSAPYSLCLNGKVDQAGKDLLCQFGEFGAECYYDFQTVDADEIGTISYQGSVGLPKGSYDVTFIIKDVNDDYKPVLVRDHWRFEIGAEAPQ